MGAFLTLKEHEKGASVETPFTSPSAGLVALGTGAVCTHRLQHQDEPPRPEVIHAGFGNADVNVGNDSRKEAGAVTDPRERAG